MAGGAAAPLNLRWTIGDVAPVGFEALRLALHGARRVFGPGPDYHVFVNSISVDEARERTGPVPAEVRWHQVPPEPPTLLEPHLDEEMSEGTSWKFAPIQIDPNVRELAFDNDVILWALPDSIGRWLEGPGAGLIAEDVAPGGGRFQRLAGPEPRNAGIRGTPAGFELEAAIAAILAENPARLDSELDEQGLQVAALARAGEPLVVSVEDVSICSPFPPHLPELGRCGAHFVGLNARSFDWDYYGRPAIEVRREHWERHRPALYERVGLTLPAEAEAMA